MSDYTSTTDATREQLMDALKERDERIEELEAENERLRAALKRIANMDYRGSRPTEQTIAYEALQETDDE